MVRQLHQQSVDGRDLANDPRVDPMIPAAEAFLAIQRGRVPVVNGAAQLIFPQAFPAGTMPVVNATLEAPANRAYSYTLVSLDNTQATFAVVATSALSVNIAVGNLNLFTAANVPGGAMLHIHAERS